MKKKFKLFVWTSHCPDYTAGLAFAIARTEDEAKKLVLKAHGFKNDFYNLKDWGDLSIYPVGKKVAFAVSGGG